MAKQERNFGLAGQSLDDQKEEVYGLTGQQGFLGNAGLLCYLLLGQLEREINELFDYNGNNQKSH